MAHALRLLVLSLLFSLSLASPASEQASKADLEAQKESLQLKIDTNQALTQKDIENLKSQLDGAGKRIDDQSNRIGDIGLSVTWFGILITLLFGIGGFSGYISAKNKAKEEAQQASKEWIKDNQAKLERKIQQLEETVEQVQQKAEQAHQQIDNSASRVEQHSQDVDALMDRIESQIVRAQSISPEDKIRLHDNIKNITEKPESEYSFKDWNKRAFDCYNSEKFEEAALYWKRASEIPNIGNLHKVIALFFRAIVFRKMNQTNEAISIYEQIIRDFGADSAPTVRRRVAGALVNKGVCLRQLGKPEDAIAVYDQVISDYAADSNPAMREPVAGALNGKGFTYLQKAKQAWAEPEKRLALLEEAQVNLSASLKKYSDSAITLGNLAYTQWLLGDQQASEDTFRSALTAPGNGGEFLYRATLDDIAQYPVPEDEGFRAMVERLWQEYQAQAPAKS